MLRLLLVIALLFASGVARAEPDADPKTEQARELFRQGARYASDTRWGEALAHFERSAALRPHPGTTFNIAICHRALGRYTRAERAFRAALAENTGGELAESVVHDITGYLREIDATLVRVSVTLTPATASITVDGSPLEVVSRAPLTLRAGTLAAGEGQRPPGGKFVVVLDPGTHVLLLRRPGYADAVVRKSYRAGQRGALKLELDRLPASLSITSNEARAAVSIDGVDVGTAPVRLSRPAGSYRILVRKEGYLPYDGVVRARPGQSLEVPARLIKDEPALTERWWFWTAAGVVVAGAVLGTYAATRPEPERPAVDGGGLGWAIRAP